MYPRRRLSAFLLLFATSLAQAEDRSAPFQGGQLHYTVDGHGSSDLILIHGWTCNASFWRLQIPELSKHYRVISIDLPGHGASDAPASTSYTIEHFAEGVDAVMRHAAVERAALFGHSMGLPVAMKVLQNRPDAVLAIVAVDGPIWKFQRRTVPQWLKDMQRDYKTVAGNFIESMFTSQTPLFVRAEIKRKMLLTPPHVGLSAMIVMGASDVWLRGATTVPVLALMAGRKSGGADGRKSLHSEVFRNLRYEVWQEAGHFLMMEQPERFNRAVLDFLHTVSALHSQPSASN
ncbi:carboxylesterase [Bryobacterales bacterium F-183]|nr:carboxylesterase [Bryobacterales bacterium F-183]